MENYHHVIKKISHIPRNTRNYHYCMYINNRILQTRIVNRDDILRNPLLIHSVYMQSNRSNRKTIIRGEKRRHQLVPSLFTLILPSSTLIE